MQEIIETLKQFRDDRDWAQYHTPQALARAINIEAAELNKLFLWSGTPGKLEADVDMTELGNELADVMIYALNLCAVTGLDPYEIIFSKINQNEEKYPEQDKTKF